MENYNYYPDYLYHHGVKGMKWGKRKAKYEYTYAYGQKPKNAYQKAMRSLGGTKMAKGAIKISGMSDTQKKNALKEQAILADEKAYNKAAKKAHKTGGQMTYDVATGKYSVSKPVKATNRQITRDMNKTFNDTYKDLHTKYKKHNSATAADRAYAQAKKINTKHLIDTYGKERMDQYYDIEHKKAIAAGTFLVGSMAGMSVVALVANKKL